MPNHPITFEDFYKFWIPRFNAAFAEALESYITLRS